jgi:hypothetical protein
MNKVINLLYFVSLNIHETTSELVKVTAKAQQRGIL